MGCHLGASVPHRIVFGTVDVVDKDRIGDFTCWTRPTARNGLYPAAPGMKGHTFQTLHASGTCRLPQRPFNPPAAAWLLVWDEPTIRGGGGGCNTYS